MGFLIWFIVGGLIGLIGGIMSTIEKNKARKKQENDMTVYVEQDSSEEDLDLLSVMVGAAVLSDLLSDKDCSCHKDRD